MGMPALHKLLVLLCTPLQTEINESDSQGFPRTVKLLWKYKGEDTVRNFNMDDAVKSVGNNILSILSQNSDISHALIEQKEWWSFAKNLHSRITVAEANKTVLDLNENVVGCYHTTGTIGTGFEKTSPTHTDTQSASVNWAGLPDFHMNLAENKNVGFLHYVLVEKNRVKPIIVVQDRFTTTFFYFFWTEREGGKDQVAADREVNSIRWDSQLIGARAKTVKEMRDIQCNSNEISTPDAQIDWVVRDE
jgi:hypothetical protein